MHDIWNPWHGCTKCSPGCQNCYMYALDARRGVQEASSVCRRTQNFRYPVQKDRKGNYKVRPGSRIRVNMTSDTFLADADPWRDEMWDIIRERPDVVFWLLTKRPERVIEHLPHDWGDGWDNVMMNVTCENQQMFDKRFPVLETIPAKHKGLCLAPLIGPIDVTPACRCGWIDEISAGGENYDNPRPCFHEWVQAISDTCREYRVNFFWYETGTRLVKDGKLYTLTYKSEQTKAAFFSGLSCHFNDIVFDLKLPDGTPLEKRREKCYNLERCLFCANQPMCDGCSACGDCGIVPKLISEAEFMDIRAAELKKLGREDLIGK